MKRVLRFGVAGSRHEIPPMDLPRQGSRGLGLCAGRREAGPNREILSRIDLRESPVLSLAPHCEEGEFPKQG